MPVTPAMMNWDVLINVGAMIFAVVYYLIGGARACVAPVALVKRDM